MLLIKFRVLWNFSQYSQNMNDNFPQKNHHSCQIFTKKLICWMPRNIFLLGATLLMTVVPIGSCSAIDNGWENVDERAVSLLLMSKYLHPCLIFLSIRTKYLTGSIDNVLTINGRIWKTLRIVPRFPRVFLRSYSVR